MCLSVVAQVREMLDDGEAIVELGGVRKRISIDLMPDPISVGDWVLVHTGYAIAKLDEEKAKEMLEAIQAVEDVS